MGVVLVVLVLLVVVTGVKQSQLIVLLTWTGPFHLDLSLTIINKNEID